MAISQVITLLPDPPNPATDDSATFAAKAEAFTTGQAAMGPELNNFAQQANALAVGSVYGERYNCSSSTAAADPGAGKLAFSNFLLPNNSTQLFLSETDADGLNKAATIAAWDDNAQPLKGLLRIIRSDDPTAFIEFDVSGAIVDGGSWVTLNVTYRNGNNIHWSDNDPVVLQFQRYGADGASATFVSPTRVITANGTITAADNGYEFLVNTGGTTQTLDTPAGLGAGFTALFIDSPQDVTLVGTFDDGTTSKKVMARTVCLLQSDGTSHKLTTFTLGGFRNRIRNPKMVLAQRGLSPGTYGNGTNALYTLDGWRVKYVAQAGSIVAIDNSTDVMAGSECANSLRATVNSAHPAPTGTQYFSINQPIEGFLVRDLVGKPIAIRFEVRSPKAGQHYIALRNEIDRSYVIPYTVNAANTWEVKTLTLPEGLITAGTWNWTNGLGVTLDFVLLAGTVYQTASVNQWVTGNVYAGPGQQNLLDTNGNIFAVTGVQLEKGNASGPLEHRLIHDELQFNYRYLERFTGGSANIGMMNFPGGGQVHSVLLPLAEKRIGPTMTVLSQSMINGTLGSYSANNRAYGITVTSAAAGLAYAASLDLLYSAEL